MRLFAATVPPPAALAELAGAVGALRRLPGADRLRWSGPEGWHFTLAFYGEVAEDTVPELAERLARAAHRHHPYDLRLAAGGRFGHRVLWIGAEGDRQAMRRLAGATAAAGRRAGVAPREHRPYAPHLTIARGRADGADLVPFVAALADFTTAAWTEGELRLMRSRLPGGGTPGAQPVYETVGSWPLGR
ncbi:RNA 2',3'-cyclic phosphodiesterase [Streptomyces sp. NPDC018031]|uniref:RNA 2',3'-cyclic phosphodiesterase n=1 Tax=Streptomyces sp. NPDC018031 TaxID=3365033 RepID=UPI0037AF1F4C